MLKDAVVHTFSFDYYYSLQRCKPDGQVSCNYQRQQQTTAPVTTLPPTTIPPTTVKATTTAIPATTTATPLDPLLEFVLLMFLPQMLENPAGLIIIPFLSEFIGFENAELLELFALMAEQGAIGGPVAGHAAPPAAAPPLPAAVPPLPAAAPPPAAAVPFLPGIGNGLVARLSWEPAVRTELAVGQQVRSRSSGKIGPRLINDNLPLKAGPVN